MQNNCPVCGSETKIIPAGVSKKTGKPYNSFVACPNKCKTTWNNPSPQAPQAPQAPTTNQNSESGIQLLMEEMQEVNKRLDRMALFLVEKLGTDKKAEVDVKDIPY